MEPSTGTYWYLPLGCVACRANWLVLGSLKTDTECVGFVLLGGNLVHVNVRHCLCLALGYLLEIAK